MTPMANVPKEPKCHQRGILVMSSIPSLYLVEWKILMHFHSTRTTPGMHTNAGHASDTSFCLTALLTYPPLSQLLSLKNDFEIFCSPRQPFSDEIILTLGDNLANAVSGKTSHLGNPPSIWGIFLIIPVQGRHVKGVWDNILGAYCPGGPWS